MELLHWLVHGATSFPNSDIGLCVIRNDDMDRSEVTGFGFGPRVTNPFEFDLFGGSFEGLTISTEDQSKGLHTL